MVNTAANLLTVERPRVNRSSTEKDEKFEVLNTKIEEHEFEIKKKILKKFINIQKSC